MGSKDTYHEKHPKVNAWLTSGSDKGGKAAKDKPPEMSGQLERLARRRGQDPAELAKKLPADTVRRTKYPVIETVDADGRRSFKHDTGVQDDALNASNRR